MSNLQEYRKADFWYDIKYYLSTNFKGYPKELWLNISNLWQKNTEPQQKFVIFTAGRSGSTLLLSLINSNEQIYCDGELLKFKFFNPKNVIKSYSLKFPEKIYGFKLLTHHIKDIQPDLKKNGKAFLQDLVKDGYKIIYLERENRLNQTLSMMYAILRNDWHKKKGVKNEQKKLFIDIKDFDWWINGFQALNDYEHELLKGVQHLHLSYERHLADSSKHQETIERICQFLDIPTIEADTNLKKITPPHFSSYVENVDEFVAYIKSTRFAHYVEDFELNKSKANIKVAETKN